MVTKAKRRAIVKKTPPDPEKERIIKALAAILERCGYRVRREELRQGYGWKAVSGACRVQEERLIFVDRKLPQDEQKAFLLSRIVDLRLQPNSEEMDILPDSIRSVLGVAMPQAAC